MFKMLALQQRRFLWEKIHVSKPRNNMVTEQDE